VCPSELRFTKTDEHQGNVALVVEVAGEPFSDPEGEATLAVATQ